MGVGVETRIQARPSVENALREAAAWEEMGTTHIYINTMGSGCATVDEHLDVLERFIQGWGG